MVGNTTEAGGNTAMGGEERSSAAAVGVRSSADARWPAGSIAVGCRAAWWHAG
uniref:Uncharacterized protein n=1 Tax=Arundo donax TaxID=35708 RepID=A0A0A8ZG82_ARUDO